MLAEHDDGDRVVGHRARADPRLRRGQLGVGDLHLAVWTSRSPAPLELLETKKTATGQDAWYRLASSCAVE